MSYHNAILNTILDTLIERQAKDTSKELIEVRKEYSEKILQHRLNAEKTFILLNAIS